MDDDALYVMTPDRLHRVVVGKTTESFPVALGFSPAATSHSIVYWSEGWLWEVSKRGGEPSRIAQLPKQPQTLVAAEHRVGWVGASGPGFSVWTLDDRRPRSLHSSESRIEALTLTDDFAYFVERQEPASWRIGRAPTGGGELSFTRPRPGRTPASVVAFGDGVHYQDARAGYAVQKLSLDLGRERTLAKDVVCSPLAVSDAVFCAQLHGLVEVPLDGRPPERLAILDGHPITDLVAGPKRIAWISDVGRDQSTVRVLERSRK
jgi:hypothetical protein